MFGNTETLTTLFCSGTKRSLTFFDFSFFDTWRERQNFYYADFSYIALQSTSQLNCPAQSQNLNSLTQQTRGHPVAHKLESPHPASNPNSLLFSKIIKIPSPSLPGMSFTPQSHFPSGDFIMTSVIVIFSARTHVNCIQCVHLHEHLAE